MGGGRGPDLKLGRAHMERVKDLFDPRQDNMKIKQSPNGDIYRAWLYTSDAADARVGVTCRG